MNGVNKAQLKVADLETIKRQIDHMYADLAKYEAGIEREIKSLAHLAEINAEDWRIKMTMGCIVNSATQKTYLEIHIADWEAEIAPRRAVRSQIKPFGSK